MKKAVTIVNSEIVVYSALSAPLSIDPALDGGIKLDILETLNNKAGNIPYLKLSIAPSENMPDSTIGADGEYFILISANCSVFIKSSGSWNVVDKSNDMFFFHNTDDGKRNYYALSDDLVSAIMVHTIDFGNPGGESVKYTPQALTTPQKSQARINIDAASQSYIDNAIAALKNSGAIGASVAGSIMPWMGLSTTIPQDWAIIPSVQTWYLKSAYNQLYIALGSELNPWGVTADSFSIPYITPGSSIIQQGTGFINKSIGGTKEETLTIENLPSHRFSTVVASPRGSNGTLLSSPTDRSIATEATGNVQDDGNNAYKLYAANNGDAPTLGKTNYIGNGQAHNNMPPYISSYWIIKLKNTGGSFTALINENGHLILTFNDGSTQDAGSVVSANPTYILSVTDASENISIPIPANTWIRDINVFVTGGNPAINIPAINSGDMNGQDLYPNSANLHFTDAGNLQVNVIGGVVKIQITKYNI